MLRSSQRHEGQCRTCKVLSRWSFLDTTPQLCLRPARPASCIAQNTALFGSCPTLLTGTRARSEDRFAATTLRRITIKDPGVRVTASTTLADPSLHGCRTNLSYLHSHFQRSVKLIVPHDADDTTFVSITPYARHHFHRAIGAREHTH